MKKNKTLSLKENLKNKFKYLNVFYNRRRPGIINLNMSKINVEFTDFCPREI